MGHFKAPLTALAMDLGAPAAFAMDLAAPARFQCLRMDQRRVCYDLTVDPEKPKLTIVNLISDDEIHIEDGTLTDTADTEEDPDTVRAPPEPPTTVPHRVISDDEEEYLRTSGSTSGLVPLGTYLREYLRTADTEEEPDPMLDVTWPPGRYGYELLQNLEETCLYIGDWTVKYTQ